MLDKSQLDSYFEELDREAGLNFSTNDEESLEDQTSSESKRSSVILVNGADLNPRPVNWLWNQWLARGKLHLLAGDPGQGKTSIALTLAATVTIGGRWPDGSRAELGNILIWSTEDDAQDTMLPRLLAAGADKKRCHFIYGKRVNETDTLPFDSTRDMKELEEAIHEIGGVSLLIVDPIVNAVDKDGNKNNDVRRGLQPIVDLASQLDIAVIGITHLNKGGTGYDPVMRVLGSIAFVALARVVMIAAKVWDADASERPEERRVLVRGKSNIGADYGGFEYFIDPSEPLPSIHTTKISWGRALKGSARELLGDHKKNEGNEKKLSAVEYAEKFLLDTLRDGPKAAKLVESEALELEISRASLKRASENLKINKRKHGDRSVWDLPLQLAQPDHPESREPVEPVEPVERLACADQPFFSSDSEVF